MISKPHPSIVHNSTVYRYHAYGMEIESQIALPELLPGNSDNPVNLSIHLGTVPENLDEAVFSGVRFQASPGKFLFHMDKIARYLITNGNEIIVDPDEYASESDIRLFLLGSALGALFHQQGLLPIHGSAIVYENKAIVFAGISGSGKSTLAASFLKLGYSLITDDICIVSLSEKNLPMVYPSFPQMKLWSDSLDMLGEDKTTLKKIRSGILKFALPSSENFQNQPIELAGIYVIKTKNTPGFSLESYKGIKKFNALKSNTYRLNFIKGLGSTMSHFKHLEVISNHCFIKKLERPLKGFSLDTLTSFLENDFKTHNK